MTDDGIAEVYAIAREAFSGGQKGFQFQAYPFRMTADNLARYRQDPNMSFWKNLKQGADHFEITRREPKVSVCQGRYAFDTLGETCKDDPTLAAAVAQKDDEDRRQVADLVAKGVPAVRLVYADGSGHPSFTGAEPPPSGDGGSALAILDARQRPNLGTVSRPEALAQGPREIAIDAAPAKAAGRPRSSLAALASERASPAAKPGRTVLASADPDASVSAAPPAQTPADRSLYGRMVAGVFGGDAATADPDRTAATNAPSPASARPEPSRSTKPRTTAAATADAARKPGRAKPEAAAGRGPARHVDAGPVISGAQPTGPVTSRFGAN